MKKAPSELLSRRQLLSFMGMTTGMYLVRNPLLYLVQNVIEGMISRAIAAESGAAAPRNYVFIGLPGAPSRWHFDQILMADPSSAYVANKSVATAITSSGTSNVYSYQTVNHVSGGKTHLVPPLWNTNVMTSIGAQKANQLLSNALFMRGCDLKQDGHPTNYVRQVRANGGGASLSGLVADASSTAIPAVSNLAFGTYGSLIGTPEVQLGGDPVVQLMSPFNGFRSVGFRQNDAQKQAVDVALQAISQYSLTNNPGAAALFSTRRNAEKLIRTQFGDLNSQWATLYNKYNNSIQQTVLDASAGGLMSAPIISNGNPAEFNFFNGSRPTNYTVPSGVDLRSSINGATTLNVLATSLALTEYVITNGLSSSVSVYSNPFSLQMPDGTQMTPNHDQHTAGVAVNTYQSTVYYRGLSAGILELVTALKSSTSNGSSLFDETVIHVAGDFCRAPRNDGSGADHGFVANCAAVFSGALPSRLQVVGNIVTNTQDPTYYGTWGVAGAMDYLNGRSSGIGNIASTISDLLRVNTPTPNDASYFATTGSYQAIDEAKNV